MEAQVPRVRAPGLGEVIGRLLAESRSLVADYAELAVLDARRAAIRLAWRPTVEGLENIPQQPAVLASDATGTGVVTCSFEETEPNGRSSLRIRSPQPAGTGVTSANPSLQPAITAIAAGQPQQAVQLLLPVVIKVPDDPAVHRTLGLAYYRLGDFPAAEASLRQALSLDNHNPLSYFLLGCTLSRLGDTEAAKPLRWTTAPIVSRSCLSNFFLQRLELKFT